LQGAILLFVLGGNVFVRYRLRVLRSGTREELAPPEAVEPTSAVEQSVSDEPPRARRSTHE
jgi:hypothetical protein